MKKIIIKICIAAELLCVYNALKAQAFSADYTYDANGNRITATVIYLTSSLKSAVVEIDQLITKDSLTLTDTAEIPKQGWVPGITEPFDGLEIKLYPNPTQGMLIIEIQGATNKELSEPGNVIGAWNMQGQQIILTGPVKRYNLLDLSEKPGGEYLLKINICGRVKDYKVIKE